MDDQRRDIRRNDEQADLPSASGDSLRQAREQGNNWCGAIDNTLQKALSKKNSRIFVDSNRQRGGQ